MLMVERRGRSVRNRVRRLVWCKRFRDGAYVVTTVTLIVTLVRVVVVFASSRAEAAVVENVAAR